MRLGIMGAMIEEIQSIISLMQNPVEKTFANRTYYQGKIDEIEVVAVFSRWGKVAASSTVTTLIHHFQPDMIIFTGVAGAVNPELNIGDIIVASHLFQHDMDARPFFKRGQIPLTDKIFLSPSMEYLTQGITAANQFIQAVPNEIPNHLLKQFSIHSPKVITGAIASGDQFIADASQHPNLLIEDIQADAVEMEGAAVAQVCEEHQIPYLIFRVISDKADHSAHFDFPSFIAEIASQYSAGILKAYVNQLTMV